MRNKYMLPALGLAAIACTAGSRVSGAPKAPVQKKANVIVMLIDDQGWYQTPLKMVDGMNNSRSDFIERMPHYMKFASQSARFTRAYSAAPVSGPSRGSIQTGKSVCRTSFTDVANWEKPSPRRKLIVPQPDCFIPEDATTIVEMLKSVDPAYATAHFGKWHCDEPLIHKPWPEGRRGYDRHDGEFGNSGPAYFRGDNPKDIFGITDRAVDFIRQSVREGRPFYLQVSHFAMHKPALARPETLAKYKDRTDLTPEQQLFAAMAEDLDTGFGTIMEQLARLGIEENTYIIWVSDNGIPNPAQGRRSDIPLRGTKLTLWEGGIRVPMLVKGPGIAPGSVVDTPVVGYDIFPTVCEMAGATSGLPTGIDGGSFLSLLRGESPRVAGRGESMFFHYPHYRGNMQAPSSAIVKGDWKLIKDYENDRYLLFDLAGDMLETTDLSKSNPAKYNELRDELDNYLAVTGATTPLPNPDYNSR